MKSHPFVSDGGIPHVEVGCGLGTGPNAFEAAASAARQALGSIRRHEPSLVVVFASVAHDLAAMLQGIRSVVGGTPLIGSTTAGEILDTEHHGSISLAVIASPHLQVHVGSGRGVSSDAQRAVDEALGAPGVAPYFRGDAERSSSLTSSGRTAFAILFSPGNTSRAVSRSHGLLDTVMRRSLGRLPVFGGAAADDWAMRTNYVFSGGDAIEDGVVIAVVETDLQFGIAFAHGLRATASRVKVTAARGHEVQTLDGRPAADVYAELVGATRASLEGKHLSMTTGRVVGCPDLVGSFVPNVASYFTDAGGVLFTTAVAPGTELTLLEADRDSSVGAIPEAIRKALVRGGIARPALTVLAHCALRSKVLDRPASEEIALAKELLPDVPLFGFCSFGEQAVSDDGTPHHTNVVSAALVLGHELTFAARVARDNEALRRDIEQKVVALARVHDDLERAVADRTAELSRVNQQLRREISDRVHAEALARRTVRALRTLTECNEALVRASDEVALLTRVCRSVVESGGYRMCWVGFAEHDAERTIRPVAHHGVAPGYLTVAGVTWSDADERGRGPVGTCIRTARPVVIHDVLRDPAFAPWRALAVQYRFGSMIALPLVVEERVLGAFAIYSGDVEAFSGDGEIRLLLDLAGDLAYGLSALRARAERTAMATRLVEADRLAAVGTLAAGVAHEINNPLSYVLSGIEYLEHVVGRSAAPDELAEARSALADLRTGSERIRHVVRDLKTFSRAQGEEVTLVDVRHVLDSAAKMTSNETRHRARLVKEYRDVPYVRASEARLAQVFVNLLINAAHAIPEGSAASNQIRLSTSVHDGSVLVEVSDTGTGIPESVRVRIFDPFFTTKPLGLGTGLGLSISRNIVIAAGGEITVQSEPGRGTTMRVLLPPAPEPRAEPPRANLARARVIGPRGRVLVVDDEEHVLSAIRRMLRDEHDVHCERSARTAVARIAAGERFDAMLCDLMMPDMTGVEFHAELARFAPALLGRVVFMTGGAFTTSADSFLQRSGSAWLLKPFEAAELRTAVQSRIASA